MNRVDPDPEGDAIRALGGNPERANRAAGDVVNYAARFGVTPEIRGTLAAEDLEFRSRNQGRVLERLFNTNVYFNAYRDQALDRYAELERLRRAGIRTPRPRTAPAEDSRGPAAAKGITSASDPVDATFGKRCYLCPSPVACPGGCPRC